MDSVIFAESKLGPNSLNTGTKKLLSWPNCWHHTSNLMWKSALYVSIIICIWQNRHKVFKVSVFIHEYMVPWTVLWVGVFVGNSTERVSDFFIIIIVHPFTARVLGAPQMILQPVFSIFSLFSSALWDLANSRPVNSLMLSSHLFLCLPCLLPPFTVPCKMVFAGADKQETWPYHCSLISVDTD